MIAQRCFILLTAEDMTFFLFVPMVSNGVHVGAWLLHCTAQQIVIIRPHASTIMSPHSRSPLDRLSAATSCCESVSEANAYHLCTGLSGRAESRSTVVH